MARRRAISRSAIVGLPLVDALDACARQDRFDPVAAFAALGDRTRLALVTRLSDGHARSIAGLAAETEITRQAVTKHLRVLERAGLVRSARIGRESRFAFQPDRFDDLKDYLDTVSRQWDDALSRLQRFVEE